MPVDSNRTRLAKTLHKEWTGYPWGRLSLAEQAAWLHMADVAIVTILSASPVRAIHLETTLGDILGDTTPTQED